MDVLEPARAVPAFSAASRWNSKEPSQEAAGRRRLDGGETDLTRRLGTAVGGVSGFTGSARFGVGRRKDAYWNCQVSLWSGGHNHQTALTGHSTWVAGRQWKTWFLSAKHAWWKEEDTSLEELQLLEGYHGGLLLYILLPGGPYGRPAQHLLLQDQEEELLHSRNGRTSI